MAQWGVACQSAQLQRDAISPSAGRHLRGRRRPVARSAGRARARYWSTGERYSPAGADQRTRWLAYRARCARSAPTGRLDADTWADGDDHKAWKLWGPQVRGRWGDRGVAAVEAIRADLRTSAPHPTYSRRASPSPSARSRARPPAKLTQRGHSTHARATYMRGDYESAAQNNEGRPPDRSRKNWPQRGLKSATYRHNNALPRGGPQHAGPLRDAMRAAALLEQTSFSSRRLRSNLSPRRARHDARGRWTTC